MVSASASVGSGTSYSYNLTPAGDASVHQQAMIALGAAKAMGQYAAQLAAGAVVGALHTPPSRM